MALACGGTGGHVFPGLATAHVLRSRSCDVDLWLTGKDIEKTAVGDWNGAIVAVPAEGFANGVSVKSLRAAWQIIKAGRKCTRIMRTNKPDVLLAMGSYASVGPVIAALRLKVPYVLHEANVLPGRAVSLFSRRAAAIAGSFEETRHYLSGRRLIITGMPLRRNLECEGNYRGIDLPDPDAFTLMVTGGSRGAHRLNEMVSEAVVAIHRRGRRIQVIHLSGVDDEGMVRRRYEKNAVPHVVYAFVHEMGALYSSTDLAICRAGASTCAELTSFGVPALLVPYPYAAHDHQTANARALEKSGAADVAPEKDLSAAWLVDYITGSMDNPKRLARISAALKSRSSANAAERLADLIEKVAMGSDAITDSSLHDEV